VFSHISFQQGIYETIMTIIGRFPLLNQFSNFTKSQESDIQISRRIGIQNPFLALLEKFQRSRDAGYRSWNREKCLGRDSSLG